MKLSDINESTGARLWIGPLLGLVVAIFGAALTLYVDAQLFRPLPVALDRLAIIPADPDTARVMLAVIAASMVLLLVFTFTTTTVVIQLASAQYTPRLMRSVLRDRITKVSLTLFITTFVYAMIVLRSVVERSDMVAVPELSLAITYLLVIASLFSFVMYIDHIAHAMRVGTVIERVTAETMGIIERTAARHRQQRGADKRAHPLEGGRLVRAAKNGSVSHIDEAALARLASERDLHIELLHRVGDYVPSGAVLARVQGFVDDEVEHAILDAIGLARARTMQQDIAFGFRQLVDIANRALSPGINDSTTAVQCIDGLHDLLRRLADEPEPSPTVVDEQGRERLIVPRTTWADYVNLASTEIRIYGGGSPQIPRRLEAMLLDLLAIVPSERRPPLERELRLLGASVVEQVELHADREAALHPHDRGMGAAHH